MFLADVENFAGIAFFVIAFIGWIIKMANENKQGNQRNGNRKRQETKSEVDEFLRDTRREPKKRQRKRRRTPEPEPEFLTDDDIEIIEEPPRRRPPRQRKRSRKSAPTPRPEPVPVKEESLSSLSDRHIQSSFSNDHLSHDVDSSVASHMGTFSAESTGSLGQQARRATTRDRKGIASEIAGMMKSKRGVRNALIINEVLSPPLSLRDGK